MYTSRVGSTAKHVPIPRGCVHCAVSLALLASVPLASPDHSNLGSDFVLMSLLLQEECLFAGKMIMDTKDHKQSQA